MKELNVKFETVSGNDEGEEYSFVVINLGIPNYKPTHEDALYWQGLYERLNKNETAK